MMKLKKLIFSFLFVFLTTENLFAKALPPGTGIGDVPANVLILLINQEVWVGVWVDD